MTDNIAQPTERVTSQSMADAEMGSPVITVVTKRIRAARKRLAKIERIEGKAQDQPDKIDKDQRETLSSKTKTVANIEELERLIPLLEEAKEEETGIAVKKAVEQALAEERASVAAQAPPTPIGPEAASDDHRCEIESETVDRMLHLLYFSQTFDFHKPGDMTQLERNAALSYYNQHYPERHVPLTPDDLMLMCKLGNLMVSRPTTECFSHAETLQKAHDLAMQWLHPTDTPIYSLDNSTMEQVSSCLERVMASDYVTVRPVLAEVPVAEAEGGYVLVPDNGHSQAAGSHPIRSERPPSQEDSSPPSQGGHMQQPTEYMAPSLAVPNGQFYPEPAPPLSFMTNGSMGMGGSDSIHSQEQGNSFPRPSQQQHFQSDVPHSAYTNSHLPVEGRDDASEQSEGRGAVPPHASLQGPQGSYGTRQRGDGSDRQGGGYNRDYRGDYEGSAPRGRGPRGGRVGGGRARGRSENYRGRGNYGSDRGDFGGRGFRGGYQRSSQERPELQSNY